MILRLSDIAEIVGGRLYGEDRLADGVGIDSRTLGKDGLFFALPGMKTDGHRFVAGLGAQAAGAIVTRRLKDRAATVAQIVVSDVRKALADLACAWRKRLSLSVIALTGSNGKTTTKEMLTSILRKKHKVGATQGNLNNHLGVPLTLLSLDRQCDVAVIEMGANHKGEIGYLCDIAKPRIGMVLNVGLAHLEGFGDIDGVAQAKGELYESLPAEGIAVVNMASPYRDRWMKTIGERKVVTFDKDASSKADVYITDRNKTSVGLSIGGECRRFLPCLPGAHNLDNAAAAAAAAYALGIDADTIVRGLNEVRPLSGRMRFVSGVRHCRLIDDCYNANPTSLAAAVRTVVDLVETDEAGRADEAWLVLGDMGELGDRGMELHEEAGRSARKAGIKRLFTVGKLAEHASSAFGEGAHHFAHPDALIDYLNTVLTGEVIVLIKGSRCSRMERVVDALEEKTQCAESLSC